MTPVVICIVDDPHKRYSATSTQVSMPPHPDIGKASSLHWLSWETHLKPIGLIAGPEKPLIAPFPLTLGRGTKSSSPTSINPATVLIAVMPF